MRATKYAADLEALGRFIRERRRSLGLTQTELGARLGWVQERVSLLENGKYGTPSLPMLAALAEALEVGQADVLATAGYLEEEVVAGDGRVVRGSQAIGSDIKRLARSSVVSGGQNGQLVDKLSRLQDQLVLAEERMAAVQGLHETLAARRNRIEQLTKRIRGSLPEA